MKAATLAVGVQYFQPNVFQSTPPVKAATSTVITVYQVGSFQSTPPVKAATVQLFHLPIRAAFQSTPPVKAATFSPLQYFINHCISIHAAREGGDWFVKFANILTFISIHAAREGGDT